MCDGPKVQAFDLVGVGSGWVWLGVVIEVVFEMELFECPSSTQSSASTCRRWDSDKPCWCARSWIYCLSLSLCWGKFKLDPGVMNELR